MMKQQSSLSTVKQNIGIKNHALKKKATLQVQLPPLPSLNQDEFEDHG